MRTMLYVAIICAAGLCARLGAQALHLTPDTCPATITAIGSCPAEGCGGVSDAVLNLAKNRTDAPTGPQDVHVHDIVDVAEPTDWLTGQERSSIAGDEGRKVRLTAYLKVVKTETSGETCNCELHTLADTDLHLVMVEHKHDLEADAVTAEITPRVRQQSHPGWTSTTIGGFTGKYVRLTGWLMLDTAHVHHAHKANNNPNDHAGSPLNRATNWEVHPVTTFEVCNSTIAKCKAGTGWTIVP